MSDASIRTQWKKGQSGNPHGRPKKMEPSLGQREMLAHFARILLDQPCPVWGDGTETRRTRLLLDVVKRAEKGELASIKFLFGLSDRADHRRPRAGARRSTRHAAITRPATGPVTGEITGQITGLITGQITGRITGLRGAHPAHQTIDGVAESQIRVDDVETIAIPAKPDGVNGAHVNGSHMNGAHGKSAVQPGRNGGRA